MNIPSLLGKLSVCLREQNECSRIVPLMTVAFIFRTLFSVEDETAVEDRRIEQQLVVDDALKIIKQSCRRLMNETEQQYVAKKTVPRQVFVKYFEVIERNLAQRIVGQDGEVFSFFESLHSLMPELTADEYRDRHKSRVEYLARLAYDRAVKELRKNM